MGQRGDVGQRRAGLGSGRCEMCKLDQQQCYIRYE